MRLWSTYSLCVQVESEKNNSVEANGEKLKAQLKSFLRGEKREWKIEKMSFGCAIITTGYLRKWARGESNLNSLLQSF